MTHKERLRQARQAFREANPSRKRSGECSIPTHGCQYETPEEEQEARQAAVEAQLIALRAFWPILLARFSRIPDPRNPQTIKHKMTTLLVYGMLCFIYRFASRREANREMTMPLFQEHLMTMFPELETMPHSDTLFRLLRDIEVEQIQEATFALFRRLIRNKKFRKYLLNKRYVLIVDGTGKFTRTIPFAVEALHRRTGKKGEMQYYVYVLEAMLLLNNGVSLPLYSEILSCEDGAEKQDCELRAFRRLAAKIKEEFRRLPITILLDGIYPNGPLLALLRSYNWDFMITLKDDSLLSVWKEAEGLHRLDPQEMKCRAADRRQRIWYVNDIHYRYGPGERQQQTVHLVVCAESWEEVDAKTAEIVRKKTKYAWLSGCPLTEKNVYWRCNKLGRRRWAIENQINVEKNGGYAYKHAFSTNWPAMKGYQYLLRLGHLLNSLALMTISLADLARERGISPTLHFLYKTLTGPWLSLPRLEAVVAMKPTLTFL